MEIGYAIFGTPHGLQCKSAGFISEVDIRKYIDLDGEKVDLGNDDQLFRTRKISNGRDLFIFYCQYAFARETVSNRPGTFYGASVVLKNTIMAPEIVLGALFEMINGIKSHISPKSKRILREVKNIPLKKPLFLDFSQELLNAFPDNALKIEDNKAILSKKCSSYEEILSFLEMSTINTSFFKYDDLYCLWDKGGGSKILYPKLKTILSYQTFASKMSQKKQSLKSDIEKALSKKKQSENQLEQIKKELKADQKAHNALKSEVFRQQNKLHLQKTESEKLNKRIRLLAKKEEEKLGMIKKLDNEIDQQREIILSLRQPLAEMKS